MGDHLKAGEYATTPITYMLLSTSSLRSISMTFFSNFFGGKDGKFATALKDVRATTLLFLPIVIDFHVRSIVSFRMFMSSFSSSYL